MHKSFQFGASCLVSKPPTPNLQDPYLNPFNSVSAHHRPIGTGAQYASISDVTTICLNIENFTALNVGGLWGANVYQAVVTDPTVTVSGTASGLPYTTRMPTINPAAGGDSKVYLYDWSATTTVHEFFQWNWNGGAPTASGRKSWDAQGPGHGATSYGFSASGVAGLFGLNRGFEINDNSWGPITHVMQLAGRIRDFLIKMENAFTWPAVGKDGSCDGITVCNGNIPYGQLFAIPPGTPRPTLTPLGLRLFDQLTNYGAYFIDGAGGSPSRADQFVTSARRIEFVAQMDLIYPLLRAVLNNTSGTAASGGGTPIAPNTAWDA